jgi:hypothetical protein
VNQASVINAVAQASLATANVNTTPLKAKTASLNTVKSTASICYESTAPVVKGKSQSPVVKEKTVKPNFRNCSQVVSGDASIRSLRVTSGSGANNEGAALTFFTDTEMQCINEKVSLRASYRKYFVAVNPFMFGVTREEWVKKYAFAPRQKIPWCNRLITLTLNGHTQTFIVGDTCQPCAEKECGEYPVCDFKRDIDFADKKALASFLKAAKQTADLVFFNAVSFKGFSWKLHQ